MVYRRRQHGYGDLLPVGPRTFPDVLVVQVEAEGRLEPCPEIPEGGRLGRHQAGRVAIEVDAGRVIPLRAGRAVGIEDGQQGAPEFAS